MEVETQLQIAASLSFISEARSDQLLKQSEELGKMLDGLSSFIRV
jgi:four helix bundle protein